jgi:hypothetical protein
VFSVELLNVGAVSGGWFSADTVLELELVDVEELDWLNVVEPTVEDIDDDKTVDMVLGVEIDA